MAYRFYTPRRNRNLSNTQQEMPLAKLFKCLQTISAKTSTTPVECDNQALDTTPDNDALAKALAQAFSSDTIKDSFRNEMLKPVIEKVDNHDRQISNIAMENNALRAKLDELKQYIRRNALRVFNPTWKEMPDESTDDLILNLSTEFGLSIKRDEISRSHRVGKPIPGKPRPILVKFISYRSRQKLFEGRKQITERYPYIRVNEDLTKATKDLAYKARELRRQGRLQDTWVHEGKVFVRTYEGGQAAVVSNECELTRHLLPTTEQLFSNVAGGQPLETNSNPTFSASQFQAPRPSGPGQQHGHHTGFSPNLCTPQFPKARFPVSHRNQLNPQLRNRATISHYPYPGPHGGGQAPATMPSTPPVNQQPTPVQPIKPSAAQTQPRPLNLEPLDGYNQVANNGAQENTWSLPSPQLSRQIPAPIDLSPHTSPQTLPNPIDPVNTTRISMGLDDVDLSDPTTSQTIPEEAQIEAQERQDPVPVNTMKDIENTPTLQSEHIVSCSEQFKPNIAPLASIEESEIELTDEEH